ncbi:glycosyltransferase family 25 protein [Hoeflea sp.]|uniref:glycosyltransferase family 25 protein n=1 Tax=Hoeflea sp. TaxID=1940281 RepID=UPI0019B43FFB|nr:glycosyltransferase family 25 protein [Hoeflea sp.]MBC7282751.1 glycosyltransferase family 25 protein [Hoeflea sp.]
MTIPCYYINLDRSPERDASFRAECARAGIEPTRVAAVDGRTIDAAEQARLSALKSGRLGLGPGEMACYLSHRKVWAMIRDGDADWAFVAEDDIHFSADAGLFFENDSWLPASGVDIVKAETARQRIRMAPALYATAHGHDLRILQSYHGGTAGYFVSRTGAARLLELTEGVCDALDHVMFHEWIGVVGHLSILQLDPALCIQDYLVGKTAKRSGFKSTLDKDRAASSTEAGLKKRPTGLALIRREVGRPFRRLGASLRAMVDNARGVAVIKRIPIREF